MSELIITPDVIDLYKDLLVHPDKYGCAYQPLHEAFVGCDEVTPQDKLFEQYLNYINKPLPKVVFYIIMQEEFPEFRAVEPLEKISRKLIKGGCAGYRLKLKTDMTDIAEILFNNEICRYPRGSVVYGTYEEGISDRDWLVVVRDCCQTILADHPNSIYQETLGDDDFQFITESEFIRKLERSDIEVLECVFSCPDEKYRAIADENLNKWNLRQSVSGICSNSWVKAKKKLIVEKDYNLRVAQKSLWHSMRIYMFGIQIAREGSITDFSEANWLWDEIKNSQDTSWEYYKTKYQPLFNSLRSDFVKLCGKPKKQ